MQPLLCFAAIDFETTGAVPGWPVEPWQVAVVRVDLAGERKWESLLRVGPRPFHPRAPGRHAALREELARAPSLLECLDELREFCGGLPLVGHNVATEQKCLREAAPMERFGPWIDTLKVSRAAWPALRSHALEDVLMATGLLQSLQEELPGRGAHDALFDALGSARLLQHVASQPGWTADILGAPDQSAYQRMRSGT